MVLFATAAEGESVAEYGLGELYNEECEPLLLSEIFYILQPYLMLTRALHHLPLIT